MQIGQVQYKNILGGSSILKPNYHLNYGKKRIDTAIKNSMPFEPLVNLTSNVYTGGIFKRVFVTDKKFGIPYISAQHMMNNNPLDVAKLISKKLTPRQHDMTLRTSQILISCAGTIGNARLIDKRLDGVIGSQDIIRVIAENEALSGYIYAYLSSPTAYNYMQSYIYGSVVPRIEPNTLEQLPVPILSESVQKEVHKYIIESSEARFEANKLLEEADFLFHSLNEIQYSNYHLSPLENDKYLAFTSNIRRNGTTSLKAKNHSKRILEIQEQWGSKPGIYLSDYVVKPFRIGSRGVYKRIDSDVIGLEMVSQGDLHKINPQNFKRVIVKKRNEEDFAKENQVLFPAVGNGSSEGEILFRPTLAYKSFTNRLLSGDIGRFDCLSLKHAAYLYVALRSKGGFRMMRAYYYGTQLRRPLWELLKHIKVPLKDITCFNLIADKVIQAYDLRFDADSKENAAISIVEKEIESWQK